MEKRIVKIKNLQHLDAEINSYENSGYQECQKDEAQLKIVFQETDYEKQQKTVYFK